MVLVEEQRGGRVEQRAGGARQHWGELAAAGAHDGGRHGLVLHQTYCCLIGLLVGRRRCGGLLGWELHW